MERLRTSRCDLVVAPDGHQRRYPYLAEALCSVPVFEVADYEELVGPVHCLVDLVAIKVLHGANQRIGPGIEPAQMAPVELHHGVLVIGVMEFTGVLIAP